MDQSLLPEKVAAMRSALLDAARGGNIEALRTPLEWNELKPEVADTAVADPIAYWKEQSEDGNGRQVLATLLAILESPPAVVSAPGAPTRYVWPGFAEVDLGQLTPAQEVLLYKIVPVADARAMRERKTWTWYRLSIGADGTWHSFLLER